MLPSRPTGLRGSAVLGLINALSGALGRHLSAHLVSRRCRCKWLLGKWLPLEVSWHLPDPQVADGSNVRARGSEPVSGAKEWQWSRWLSLCGHFLDLGIGPECSKSDHPTVLSERIL